MANAIGEAFITLRPDLSKFSGEAGQAMASSMQKMSSSISTVGRGLTLGLTAPILAFAGVSVKAAMDMETAFVGMTNKLEGTPEQFEKIRAGAIAMSESMPVSATAILDIAKNAGQLGIATEDVLGFSKTIAQMAMISDMSAEAIASGMAKIANVMGDKGAESFNKMANAIAAMGKIGASTEGEIIDMAQRLAGAGSLIGLSTADVLAFANAIATAGIEAEAGGTAFSKLFMEMNNAVSGLEATPEQLQAIADAQTAVRDSGYDLESAQRSVRDANEEVADSHKGVRDAAEGINDANLDLADAYQELGFAQTRQALSSFESRKEFLSIAQAQQHLMEVWSKFPAQAIQMKEAQLSVAEATDRLNKARSKGTAREVQRAELNLASAQQRLNELLVSQRGYTLDVAQAWNSVEDAKRREGTAYTNAAKETQAANKKVQDSIKAKEDAQDKYTESLKRQRNAEEGRLDAQRNVVRANEAYFASQRKLAEITESVTGKLGIFAKVAGVSADQFAAKFKTDARGAIADFLEGIQRLKKEGVNVDLILKKLGLDDERMKRAILGVSAMSGAENDLRAMLEKSTAAHDHGNEVQRQTDALNKTAAAQLEMTKNQIINAAAAFGKEFLPMLRQFLIDAKPVIEQVGKLAKSFGEMDPTMKKIIVAVALLAAGFGPFLIMLGQIISTFAALIVITGGMTIALGPLLLIVLAVTAAVLAGYLVWKHWDEIKAIVVGAVNAIIGAFNSVIKFLSTNWREILGLITFPFTGPLFALATDAFGIRSALERAFTAVMEFLGGAWKGVKEMIAAPFKAAASLAVDAWGLKGAIINAFNGAKNWLYNAGRDVVNGFIGGIKAMLPSLKSLLTSAANSVIDTFSKPLRRGSPSKEFIDIGEDVMSGLQIGLRSGFGPVQADMGGYADATAASWQSPSLGVARSSGGSAASAGTSQGGGGGFARAAFGGVVVNNYGPITSANAPNAFRNIGWGVETELQRRGVYT